MNADWDSMTGREKLKWLNKKCEEVRIKLQKLVDEDDVKTTYERISLRTHLTDLETEITAYNISFAKGY